GTKRTEHPTRGPRGRRPLTQTRADKPCGAGDEVAHSLPLFAAVHFSEPRGDILLSTAPTRYPIPMPIVSLHDRERIEPVLRRNVFLRIYALGDLDDFFW